MTTSRNKVYRIVEIETMREHFKVYDRNYRLLMISPFLLAALLFGTHLFRLQEVDGGPERLA